MRTANFGRVAQSLVALALVAVAIATLWPLPGSPGGGSSLCLACGELGGVDLVLNVILFLPLGISLALAWPGRRWPWFVPGLVSLTVEVLQMRLIPGRDASLGDLVANTTGGLLGLALISLTPSLLLTTRGRRSFALWTHAVILLFSCIVAWALLPASVHYRQFVQIHPVRAGYAPFTGRVSVTIFDRRRQIGELVEPSLEPVEYTRGDLAARVTVTGQPPEIPPGESLIFRLANSLQMLVQLSQRHDALAVRFRKRANLLLLRSPTFVLSGVFPNSRDSIAVTLRSERAFTHLSVRSPHGESALEAPITLGRGWELFSPFRAVKPTTEQILRWTFLALLLGIPTAVSCIAWGARGVVAGAATTCLVLVAIPFAAGLARSLTDEWLAAGIGMAIGSAAGILAGRLGGYRNTSD